MGINIGSRVVHTNINVPSCTLQELGSGDILVHKVIGREQNIESKMAKLAVGNKIDVEYQSTGT